MALRYGAKAFTEDEVPQGSEAWKSVRLGCLTGSRCSPVMIEKRPSAMRDTLRIELCIECLTHRMARLDFQTDAMLQGLQREPEAIRYAEAEMLELIKRVGFVYLVGEHVGCSPDGYIGDWDALVSVKCREMRAHYEHMRSGTIPADALRQMAHECATTGCRVHNYISYSSDFPPALRYRRTRLTWEQLEVDAYVQAMEVFLQEVKTEVAVMQQLSGQSPWLAAAEAIK